mmetsp:Transcript_13269/g.19814  ORF Transcript_13269/g.19814 Transcript_13269/m.19814 type:complete len:84 (-) Transcript_13269:323-574(-)
MKMSKMMLGIIPRWISRLKRKRKKRRKRIKNLDEDGVGSSNTYIILGSVNKYVVSTHFVVLLSMFGTKRSISAPTVFVSPLGP